MKNTLAGIAVCAGKRAELSIIDGNITPNIDLLTETENMAFYIKHPIFCNRQKIK